MDLLYIPSIHAVQSPERADELNPAPVESVNSSCNWHDIQQFNWLVGFCISHGHVVFHSTWVGVPSPSPPLSEFGINKHFLTTIAPSYGSYETSISGLGGCGAMLLFKLFQSGGLCFFICRSPFGCFRK